MYDAAGDEDYYYAHDHLYSAVALLDDSGAVVERIEYNAYGEADVTIVSGSGTGNEYLFTGRGGGITNLYKEQYVKMQNPGDHVLIYDYEENEWVNMCLGLKPGVLSIYHPKASRVLCISLKKGFYFGPSAIRIVPVKERCIFKAFRNWLRASFSMPLLCYEKDVAICNEEHCVKLDIGFPFEYPIRIKFIQGDEGGLYHIIDTWKMQKQ